MSFDKIKAEWEVDDKELVRSLDKIRSDLGKIGNATTGGSKSFDNMADRAKRTANEVGKIQRSTQATGQATERNNVATARQNVLLRESARHAKTLAREAAKAESFFAGIGKRIGSFLRFSIASFIVTQFTRPIIDAAAAVINLDDTLVKFQQITGRSRSAVQGLIDDILNLGRSLGVQSSKVLESNIILAQAGFNLEQIRKLTQIIARTELAPSFESLDKTTEGIIAVLNQFKLLNNTDLGAQKFLDIVNEVSKNFAVESGNIIEAVRNAGGVFATAEGLVENAGRSIDRNIESFKEFTAVFSAIRSTTRLTPSVISTGLRTVIQRVQRSKTEIDLRDIFGDDFTLRDIDGQFIGVAEAFDKISAAIKRADYDKTSVEVQKIVESLGGIRQSKVVLPLLFDDGLIDKIKEVADLSDGSVYRDSEKRQESLAVKVEKLKKEFFALFVQVSKSDAFKTFIDSLFVAAEGASKLVNSLQLLLPLAALPALGGLGRFGLNSLAYSPGKSSTDSRGRRQSGVGFLDARGGLSSLLYTQRTFGDRRRAILAGREARQKYIDVNRQSFLNSPIAQNRPLSAEAWEAYRNIDRVADRRGRRAVIQSLSNTGFASIRPNINALPGRVARGAYNAFTLPQIRRVSDRDYRRYDDKQRARYDRRIANREEVRRVVQNRRAAAGTAAFLGGAYLSSTSNSLTGQAIGGALTGGATGAFLGSAIGTAIGGGASGSVAGPWGAAAGAAIGAVYGLYESIDSFNKAENFKILQQKMREFGDFVSNERFNADVINYEKFKGLNRATFENFSRDNRNPLFFEQREDGGFLSRTQNFLANIASGFAPQIGTAFSDKVSVEPTLDLRSALSEQQARILDNNLAYGQSILRDVIGPSIESYRGAIDPSRIAKQARDAGFESYKDYRASLGDSALGQGLDDIAAFDLINSLSGQSSAEFNNRAKLAAAINAGKPIKEQETFAKITEEIRQNLIDKLQAGLDSGEISEPKDRQQAEADIKRLRLEDFTNISPGQKKALEIFKQGSFSGQAFNRNTEILSGLNAYEGGIINDSFGTAKTGRRSLIDEELFGAIENNFESYNQFRRRRYSLAAVDPVLKQGGGFTDAGLEVANAKRVRDKLGPVFDAASRAENEDLPGLLEDLTTKALPSYFDEDSRDYNTDVARRLRLKINSIDEDNAGSIRESLVDGSFLNDITSAADPAQANIEAAIAQSRQRASQVESYFGSYLGAREQTTNLRISNRQASANQRAQLDSFRDPFDRTLSERRRASDLNQSLNELTPSQFVPDILANIKSEESNLDSLRKRAQQEGIENNEGLALAIRDSEASLQDFQKALELLANDTSRLDLAFANAAEQLDNFQRGRESILGIGRQFGGAGANTGDIKNQLTRGLELAEKLKAGNLTAAEYTNPEDFANLERFLNSVSLSDQDQQLINENLAQLFNNNGVGALLQGSSFTFDPDAFTNKTEDQKRKELSQQVDSALQKMEEARAGLLTEQEKIYNRLDESFTRMYELFDENDKTYGLSKQGVNQMAAAMNIFSEAINKLNDSKIKIDGTIQVKLDLEEALNKRVTDALGKEMNDRLAPLFDDVVDIKIKLGQLVQ